jgi:hypothetical protein
VGIVSDELRDRLEQEKLERARAKLNQEQREQLERQCEFLREKQIYAPKLEIAIADILYTGLHPRHQSGEIEAVFTRAHNEAADRDAKAQLAASVLEFEKAAPAPEIAKQQPAQAVDPRVQRETADRVKEFEAAKREPIAGTMHRFFDKILEAQRGRQARPVELTRTESQPEKPLDQKSQTSPSVEALIERFARREVSDAVAMRMSRLVEGVRRDHRLDRYDEIKPSHTQSIGGRKM